MRKTISSLLTLLLFLTTSCEKAVDTNRRTAYYEISSNDSLTEKRKVVRMKASETRFYQHTYDEDRIVLTDVFETRKDGLYWLSSNSFEYDSAGEKIKNEVDLDESLYYPFHDTSLTVWSALKTQRSPMTVLRKYQVTDVVETTYTFNDKLLSCYKYNWTLQTANGQGNSLHIDSNLVIGQTYYSKELGVLETSSDLNGTTTIRKLVAVE